MRTQRKFVVYFFSVLLVTSLVVGCSLPTNNPLSSLSGGMEGKVTDPAVGLVDLKNFRVVFQQDVTGTLDGKSYEKHTSLEIRHADGQVEFTRSLSGSEETASYFRMITTGEAIYRWYSVEEGCQGEAGSSTAGELLEPASMLPTLSGATRIGKETINQVVAVHYSFTQANLNISDPKPQATGDIWVAEQGGFIVKYLLSIQPVENPGREQVSATQEWSYEVSRVNTADKIQLPEDCMPVPLDIPVMEDARELTLSSGLLSFVTDSTPQTVIDFYLQTLPDLGWATAYTLPAGEIKLPVILTFNKGEDRLSLNIDRSDQSGLDVDLYLFRIPQGADSQPVGNPTPTVSAPTQPAATVDPSQSGLLDDIPLYPGVTDLVKMGSTLKVTSADTVEAIVQFYEARMPSLGWTLYQKIPANGAINLLWQKGERIVSILASPSNGVTFIVIAQ